MDMCSVPMREGGGAHLSELFNRDIVSGLTFGAPAWRKGVDMFGVRFDVWGHSLDDEADANVQCLVYRLRRPLGGRSEGKCVQMSGFKFRAPPRRTKRRQMSSVRFNVGGARSADEANAHVFSAKERERRTSQETAKMKPGSVRKRLKQLENDEKNEGEARVQALKRLVPKTIFGPPKSFDWAVIGQQNSIHFLNNFGPAWKCSEKLKKKHKIATMKSRSDENGENTGKNGKEPKAKPADKRKNGIVPRTRFRL